jgi:hypothetical protein
MAPSLETDSGCTGKVVTQPVTAHRSNKADTILSMRK